ncbi:MAG: hypothetical protein JSV50_05850 [Desulfobacteraceae bacterium]|nr:MAG: hypothetical protein JSV50_05850 [Desulfobacteraceae bacterium]
MEEVDIKNAKSAHSMAIFLHSFDDHLNDNELPISHLALLLRSQAWMMMHNALNSLAEGVSEGKQIVDRFINDYYYGINRLQDVESLDGYCDLFRKQMATGLIAPVLITQKMGNDEEFSDVVQNAFGSFGIAWRLLDDIKDIETDMMKGNHSSIYVCLPEEIKRWWDKDTGEKIDKNSGFAEAILDSVAENDVIKRIKERICSELESAAFIADDCHITGLANEFRCLLTPLKNGRDYV